MSTATQATAGTPARTSTALTTTTVMTASTASTIPATSIIQAPGADDERTVILQQKVLAKNDGWPSAEPGAGCAPAACSPST